MVLLVTKHGRLCVVSYLLHIHYQKMYSVQKCPCDDYKEDWDKDIDVYDPINVTDKNGL